MEEQILIIGNGISGVTAARHIRKLSNKKITIISDESEYFFSRTALMYIYMGHMKFEHTKPYEDWFWKKNNIELLKDRVFNVDTNNKEVETKNSGPIKYDKLILATGSKPNMFGWPGQELKGVQGLYHLSDLEGMEKYSSTTKNAVIVGGGLIGIEMAEMFLSRNIHVTFLVRESSFWNTVLPDEESEMINIAIREHGIDLRLNTELQEITSNNEGRVKAVRTKDGQEINCQFVGITAGVSPNIEFLISSNIQTEKGIIVNEYLETNIPGIYAIGDCTQHKTPPENRRPFEQIWYTGRIMGRTVAQSICVKPTPYVPGIWFNSAKFFDIEFQTYGWIFNKTRKNERTFYWQHPEKAISLRINYQADTLRVLGFNAFGMRLRHNVCEMWIEKGFTIEKVLEKFNQANFDPEFYKIYLNQIILKFNSEFEKKLRIRSKRTLMSWFSS